MTTSRLACRVSCAYAVSVLTLASLVAEAGAKSIEIDINAGQILHPMNPMYVLEVILSHPLQIRTAPPLVVVVESYGYYVVLVVHSALAV